MRSSDLRVLPAIVVLACLFLIPNARADSADQKAPVRRALVISNSEYREAPLVNPPNDAALIGKALTETGFDVIQKKNLDRSEFYASVNDFTESLPVGSVGMIYYAGHGMHVKGYNYLIPVDFAATSENGVAGTAVPLDMVRDKLRHSKASVAILVLDACRDNPFRSKDGKRMRSLGGRGLARIISPPGMLIAYSTAAGEIADDGVVGQNSVYAIALADQITQPGIDADHVFQNVRRQVIVKTEESQQPSFEDSLNRDFYFKPTSDAEVAANNDLLLPLSASKPSRRSLLATRHTPWFSTLTPEEWYSLDNDIHRRAEGMTPDEIPAVQLRANHGSVVAQTTLGLLYAMGTERSEPSASYPPRFGSGAPPVYRSRANNTKAIYWLRKAANAGFALAQIELGEKYFAGDGVDRDRDAGERWLIAAQGSDYGRATVDLAQMRATRSGKPEDAQNLMSEIWKQALKTQQADGEQVKAMLQMLGPPSPHKP